MIDSKYTWVVVLILGAIFLFSIVAPDMDAFASLTAGKVKTTIKVMPEINCANGLDDDKDGKIDCLDMDNCDGKACGTKACPAGSTGSCSKICQIGACADCSLAGKCKETNCADGKDNDNDGKVDCADADCNGKVCGTNPCSSGNASAGSTCNKICNSNVCTDCSC